MLGVSLPAPRSGNVGRFFMGVRGRTRPGWSRDERGGWGGRGSSGRKGWRGDFAEGVTAGGGEGRRGEERGDYFRGRAGRKPAQKLRIKSPDDQRTSHFSTNLLSECERQRSLNRYIHHFPKEKSKSTETRTIISRRHCKITVQ